MNLCAGFKCEHESEELLSMNALDISSQFQREGREGGREDGREGGWKERKGGREEGREGGREEGRTGGREGGRVQF